MTRETGPQTQTNMADRISIRFWGVRGGLATPGAATVRYGGNTPCVEVRCGPHLLILDGGGGIRELGEELTASGVPVAADILLSHTHMDHIGGLPFFTPMFDPAARLRFWGGHLQPPNGIGAALRRSWQEPLMPGQDKLFRADITFHDFVAGTALPLHPGLDVETIALRHPGGSIGYRIGWQGSSVCYITDFEHGPDGAGEALTAFVAGTDVLIYDASYTDEEYLFRVGWGHSTWQVAAALAAAAPVGQLVLFHHAPMHDDVAMDRIAGDVADRRPRSLVAREGMRITAGGPAAGG